MSSPYINRFLQPDSIISDLFNPQSWNRYSYVTNRPVNFSDPTGHREESGYEGTQRPVDCKKYKDYCTDDGKPKSAEELVKMRKPKTPSREVTIGPTPTKVLPDVVILHPLDSNVISQTRIYDYSYLPPMPIGYTVTFYNMNGNVQFDRNALLGMAADEVISTGIKQLVIENLKKQFEGLGLTLAGCPECTILYEGYQLASNISTLNNAFTIESHLETKTVYYPPPGPFRLDFELYRKVK